MTRWQSDKMRNLTLSPYHLFILSEDYACYNWIRCDSKARNQDMRYIIGVDLGGTQLRAALADEQGQLLDEVRVRTLVDEGPAAVIDRIVTCVERVRAALPAGGMLAGIGVGAP